ncbi:Phosphocarrier protein HPr /phosphoenolpyruvate--protein phosphotransferase /PTS system IIA component, Glc family [Consotaella salsifontis]|uniref:phosphoenolpyruvate--protein phosphotransferase n=2 Tax=Consotaella salsifontis TaxID=1365950 RepID=A0A1T4S525_9HYPH|nr:Phosphocarrier protein HPr /phosphoenolpyruvate--protein phosphotransferase /PTS system IIA component, Glc family [Consotaella salsifontis]
MGAIDLKAPLAGWLMPITEVPDPVFSGRILGDGFAIDPTEATLRAPFDGCVTSLHRARHAVTLKADNGAEVLMHLGLDTVGLKGEGFTAHVAEGDRVRQGDRLISFDMDVLAQLVRSLVVPVVLTNGEDFSFTPPATDRLVATGESLARIAPISAGIGTRQAAGGPSFRMSARIRDPNGIHARPAGMVAEIAKAASSEVIIRFGDRSASAASPVGLMLLDAQFDDVLTIEANGVDAEATVRAIAEKLGAASEADASAKDASVAGKEQPATAQKAEPADEAIVPLAPGEALEVRGMTAAPGLALGTSVRVALEEFDIEEEGAGIEAERTSLHSALSRTAETIRRTMASSTGQQADIMAAHLSFVEDPDLRKDAEGFIHQGKSAAFAWKAAIDQQTAALRKLGNKVLAERVADLEDIRHQVLAVLLGKESSAARLPEAAVLFAADILPSQFAQFDASRIAGIVLAEGGTTAHVSILAASKGIPTIVAAGPAALSVPDDQPVVVDADQGVARINPPAGDLASIKEGVASRKARLAASRAASHEPAFMTDGTRIEVVANLGGPADVAAALENGAEGCGLMRSEFLFLDRATAPSEDEQLEHYQAIATGLEGRPLIIRTLDAGADKDVPYVGLPREDNPALGMRGVRMSLWQPDLLRTQIRAILRVEPFGQAKLLLPMVATLEDLRRVRRVIDEEMQSLGRTTPIEVGIMVEVPSAALTASQFAREADFFSVGTNDLTQYTLAMDRMSSHLADQLDPFHPAVLRLIGLAAEGAKAHGRWVGVCGSLASFPKAAPLLIGLGVTELSATAGAIPEIKALVRTLDRKRCAEIAQEALKCESGEAVRHLVATVWPEV